MKKFLLVSFFIAATCISKAQVHNAFPPEAADFYNRAIQKVKPEIASYINNTASSISSIPVDTDSLCRQMKRIKSMKNIDEEGCRTIALLILVRCSMNADAALKQKVLKMQQNGDNKKNYEETESLVNRKSNLAGQVKLLLADVIDENLALKDLR